jgi:HAD superfamily hydrolase (TIGR01509 family)
VNGQDSRGAGGRALRASTPSDASRQASVAIIFDLDGVLVDSEQAWDQARKDVVDANGGAWKDSATRDMLGMSSKEWPVYVVEELGAQLTPEQVNEAVVEAMLAGYREHLPLLPGAREAIERLSERYTLGLASSSNRPVIDVVLETMGVTERFAATVSSEEVERGKPAPDVYLEAMRRLGISEGVAIEDSENGIRSAHAAGLRVIAIPNPHFPPADDALALADEILENLDAVVL